MLVFTHVAFLQHICIAEAKFFVAEMGQCNCPHHHHPMYRFNEEMSDYDDYDYTDDDDSDEEFWESIASRLRSKYEARKFMPKGNNRNQYGFGN